jgi:hypothetical protein
MSKAVAKQHSAPPAEVATSIIQVIERAASDPNVDIDKMERLLEMQERIMVHQAKQAYAADLAAMQPNLPVVDERGKGHNSIKYALWEDINEAIKPVLAEHGFNLSFRVGEAADKVTVTAVLLHAQGHAEETTITLPLDQSGSKNAVQAVGSSVSYGKRYTALALLNISVKGEDDDGMRGGANPITQAQADELNALADEVGADKPAFCKYLGVKSIADIPSGKFNRATQALEAKRAQQ